MRIASGAVTLAAESQRVQATVVEERTRVWVVAPQAPEPAPRARPEAEGQGVRVSLSDESRDGATAGDAPGLVKDTRAWVRRLLLEKMFGVGAGPAPAVEAGEAPPSLPPGAGAGRPPPEPAAAPAPAFGLEYERVEVRTDTQRLRVVAQGEVLTSDGRRVNFALASEQERSEASVVLETLRLGAAARPPPKQVDPLALDLDGDGVRLEAAKMGFDLDGDGASEQVSRLSQGDAWLALDRNRNGRVDDGRELFGPTTGSGFGELSALDGDGDGFIDEDDAAFSQLRLWRPDGSGGGSLVSLLDANVGALAVASVASPFQLDGGVTRESGVYLREDGSGAGLVQHVDLAV